MKLYVFLALAGLLVITETGRAGVGPFPKKVHRILFLGNSITYDGKYIVDMETYFVTHYPKKHWEFINVGLPSETVSGLSEPGHADGKFPRPDLHERLARVLALVKPDLVFACYGMNDGIYMPFDEERFRKFKEGILWLHQQVVKSGAPIIHLTPPVYDEQIGGHKGYAFVLDRYSEWLLEQRGPRQWQTTELHTPVKKMMKEHGGGDSWMVVDLHFPMKKYLEERRQADPSFRYAKDGIHPDSLGHWIMAREVLSYLGEKGVAGTTAVQEVLADHPNGLAILGLVGKKQQMMKDAWLTAARHIRPGMNTGLPLPQAKEKEKEMDRQIRVLAKEQ
jgi:lysophospholipase L1-like esterase